MAQLRQDWDQFVAHNVAVLVVGPEDADAFRTFWEREQLPFIGLPDPDQQVLGLYGQEVKFLRLGRLPAQMIIDPDGLLRQVHYGDSMADIPTTTDTLAPVVNTTQNTPSP
jgi:peroxiredoxin Q/BCP